MIQLKILSLNLTKILLKRNLFLILFTVGAKIGYIRPYYLVRFILCLKTYIMFILCLKTYKNMLSKFLKLMNNV